MNEKVMTTTYAPGKLIVSVVPREQGDMVMSVAKKAGARGGTIMLGHSTVENRLLLFLGLDSKEIEVVLTLLSHTEVPGVLDALANDDHMRKVAAGAAFCLDVCGILRHVACAPGHEDEFTRPLFSTSNTPDMENTPMSANATHELITVIANAGFSGDIMDAARKAGATGGTIINARGTGREEDVTFFGITIVPEKEFIMIVVPKDKAEGILEAIKQTPCLNKPGAGIAFCIDVEHFMPLGKKDN